MAEYGFCERNSPIDSKPAVLSGALNGGIYNEEKWGTWWQRKKTAKFLYCRPMKWLSAELIYPNQQGSAEQKRWNSFRAHPSPSPHNCACKIFAKIVPQKIICGRVRPWFCLVPLKEFFLMNKQCQLSKIPLFKVFRWNIVIQTQPITRRTRLWIPCNELSSTMGEHGASVNGYKMKLHTTFATRLTI